MTTMKTLIITLLAAVLAACATPPPEAVTGLVVHGAGTALEAATGSTSVTGGHYAYGTLATTAVEAELAPLYTRNAMLRRTAARRLDAGRISVNVGETILGQTNFARGQLEEAQMFSHRPDVFKARIGRARDAQDKAAQLLQEESK